MFILKVADRFIAAELAGFMVTWEVKFDFENVITEFIPENCKGYEQFKIYRDRADFFELAEVEFSVTLNTNEGEKRFKLSNLESRWFISFTPNMKDARYEDEGGDGKTFWIVEEVV